MTGVPSSARGHSVWTALAPAGSTVFRAASARGVRVTGADGRRYLCADSGLWNVPLGYGNPVIADAVARALHDSSYLPVFRSSHVGAESAASALLALAGGRYRRVVFSTSGGAANDAAMKLVRHYWHLREAPQRRLVIGLEGSYHGLTHGSHALSGDALLHDVYALDRRSVRHVPFDDGGERLEALLRREGSRVGALVLEPVLGSGCRVVPDEFLRRVQELREQYGFLLVADEVATGFHRTGPLFASERWSPAPDVLVLSKALTHGSCAAAVLLVGESIVSVADRSEAVFVHGETQAGTPSTCAAILATLAEFERREAGLLAAGVGDQLDRLADRLLRSPLVTEVTGAGCFRGVHLRHADGSALSGSEVTALVTSVREAGVLVHPGPSAIQLVPAFVFDDENIGELESTLLTAFDRPERVLDGGAP